MYPRQYRSWMAVQNAAVGSRALQYLPVEIPELGVDGGQRGHRVSLAEHEQVLTKPRGIANVGNDEAPVIQGDERDHRRERAARVQPLIHRVAALFQRQHPNIGILDRKEPPNTLTHQAVPAPAPLTVRGP